MTPALRLTHPASVVAEAAPHRATPLRSVPASASVTESPARQRTVTLDVEQLYRRYGDMVLARCRNLVRNEAEAQEVCQEVFLRIHRYREGFRGEASPTTYLFRVTTSQCLNHLRSRRRRPEDPVFEVPQIPHHDSVLSEVDTRDLLGRVMDLADERTSACVVHHFVDGMTYDEVGELLGISGAAVRKRIATFRARLRDDPPSWLSEEE